MDSDPSSSKALVPRLYHTVSTIINAFEKSVNFHFIKVESIAGAFYNTFYLH